MSLKPASYKKFYQTGFSLIELMIAMAIGTFIIAGLVSVFISSSQNYATQQALTEVQDKGRFAIKKLRESIQSAGFDMLSSEMAVEFIATGGVNSCFPGGEILLIYIKDGNDTNRRCYFLDANSNLMRNDAQGTNAPINPAVTIVRGVDEINYLFAVDTGGGGIDIVDGALYLTSLAFDGSTAGVEWPNVRAVKVELIVASTTAQVTDTPQVIINPFDKDPSGDVDFTAGDSNLHQAYTVIVPLKNRL
jgi:prepilin-type N-terminal cleavage/methylation domain-containing protein